MYDYEVLEEKPITIAEAREIMKKISSKEMTFEQKQAYEHLKKMAKLSEKKAKELKKELEELGMRKLKDIVIVRIIDLLPLTEEELKFVLGDLKIMLDKEDIAKILEIVKKYV